MDIVVTGRSALTLHRASRERRPLLRMREVPDSSVMPAKLSASYLASQNMGVFERYGLLSEDVPLELSVSYASDRVWTSNVICHVRSLVLPPRSFMELVPTPRGRREFPEPSDCRILVDALPLVFATIAGEMHDLVRRSKMPRDDAKIVLARLMCEFCGTYGRDPVRPAGGEVAYELNPVTSVEEIRTYLDELQGMKGINLARAALKLVCDSLASPMECLLFATLSYPPRMGGLSLRDVRANVPLDIRSDVLAELGLRRITPDFRIGDAPVVLEYQGSEHLEKYRVRKDKNRAQAYAKLGYAHYPMMIEDMRDVVALDRTLRDVVDLLSPYEKKSFRTRVLHILHDESYREARRRLLEMHLGTGRH